MPKIQFPKIDNLPKIQFPKIAKLPKIQFPKMTKIQVPKIANLPKIQNLPKNCVSRQSLALQYNDALIGGHIPTEE